MRLGDGTGVFTHTLPNPLNSHFTVYTYFLEQKSLCALQPTQGRSRWPRPGGTPTWSCCPRQLLTQAMWSLSEQQGQRAVQAAGREPGRRQRHRLARGPLPWAVPGPRSLAALGGAGPGPCRCQSEVSEFENRNQSGHSRAGLRRRGPPAQGSLRGRSLVRAAEGHRRTGRGNVGLSVKLIPEVNFTCLWTETGRVRRAPAHGAVPGPAWQARPSRLAGRLAPRPRSPEPSARAVAPTPGACSGCRAEVLGGPTCLASTPSASAFWGRGASGENAPPRFTDSEGACARPRVRRWCPFALNEVRGVFSFALPT